MGRSHSLSLPRRLPSMSSRTDYASPVTTPVFQPSCNPLERQASWLEKAYKPPSPWEAASRSPLGSVDEAFTSQNLQQSIASNVKAAAHRKSLPEPPAEWKARVSYEPPGKGEGRQYLAPQFVSPTKSVVSAPPAPTHYGPPFRQYQPQRSMTEANIGYIGSRPVSQPGYRPVYNTAWRR
ncbi:synaptopodin-2 [Megalops cyprinoides]|uniref:synaptopodin-2 n=1 Tax=Megalops cyprinoides TaxID=118141 RepID=UPI001864F526|nr:synaptopodin-2 [Megalops cyprinoides]